jgi:hypothetical protein
MFKLGVEADDVRAHFGLAAQATTALVHSMGAIEVSLAVLAVIPALLRTVPALSFVATALLGGVALLGTVRPDTAMATGFAAGNATLFALAALVTAARIATARRSAAAESLRGT